ncbi:MAG TPA: rhomboid family intramembrane serine protease [Longimicrobiales bacterium]|nr:rhomboid family intramembrane serine protease [Longimicrobiales bacterium]
MTPWVKRLLIANGVVFVLSSTYPVITYYGALVPMDILRRPWSVVTYMFLHANFMHILFNMIGVFFFGPRLEQRLGGRDFMWLYMVSGLMAAVFSFLFARSSPVVGASGAVFGVLLGFARFWPDEPIYIWGILPIPAKWLVGGLAVISIYSGMGGAQSSVAHFAHLGGFVGGWLFLRWRMRRQRRPTQPAEPISRIQRIAEEVRRDAQRWESIQLEQLHEINRSEVARLRDKMKATGVSSLSPDERAFLDRMAGR